MTDEVAQQAGASKSAKRRAAKKARDAAGGDEAEEAPAPAPAPAPVKEEKPAAQGASKEAEPQAKAKAKAKAKAEAKAEAALAAPPTPEPKAEAKAKAKAKAKAQAEAAETVPAPAKEAEALGAKPKAKAKAEAKAAALPADAVAEPAAKAQAKAKAKAKAKVEPTPVPQAPAPEPKAKAKKAKNAEQPAAPASAAASVPVPAAAPAPAPAKATRAKVEAPKPAPAQAPVPPLEESFVEFDDGAGGGDWEVASAVSKKHQKRAEKLAQEKADKEKAEKEEAAAMAAAETAANAAVAPLQQHVPGMASEGKKGKAKAAAAAVEAAAAAPAAALDTAPVPTPAPAAPAADEKIEEKPESNLSTVTIKVPDSKIGALIGPKGSRIKMVQEKTGVTRIDTSAEVFTVTGSPESVAMAEAAIKEMIEKGYMSLAFEDFKEDHVSLHPSVFPDLIGQRGAVVRKIKDELSVEIAIPEVPRNAVTDKKYKVQVAGNAANVERAKIVINNIAMYSHDELTHEGVVHEEMEIPDHCWRFIIGRQGSEMRHIQNNYKVKVNIPREHSMCQNVLVIGDQASVEKAKVYILKTLEKAEQPRARERNDEGDVWGEEVAEEPWMNKYMYRR